MKADRGSAAAPLSPFEEREALRLHDAGVSLVELGALYRKPYDVIGAAIARARKARADAWPFVAPNAWPEEGGDAP